MSDMQLQRLIVSLWGMFLFLGLTLNILFGDSAVWVFLDAVAIICFSYIAIKSFDRG